MRRGRWLGAVVLMCIAGVLVPKAVATQSTEVEEIRVEIRVETDGSLRVVEHYDFGDAGPPALRRELPTRAAHDEEYDRVYEISSVSAEARRANIGALTREDETDRTTIVLEDIDDPGEVSLAYVVRGAVRQIPEGLELNWPVISGFDGVGRASVVVTAPAVSWAACFAGQPGTSIPCTATQLRDLGRPRFEQDGLEAGARMTIIVGMPPGSGIAPSEMLVRPWSLARAFSPTPLATGLALALVALSGLFVVILWRTRGRDRPALTTSSSRADELTPPEGILPGQLGTVVNQRVDVVDIVGTVLDLTVRGHMHIDQTTEDEHLVWRLHRDRAQADDLHPYERVVLERIFGTGDVSREHVRLDEVAERMREGLGVIQDRLYDDVVAQGWFVERPDVARGRWGTAGLAVAASGLVVTIALAVSTNLALAGLGLIAGGGILGWGGEVAPARAPRGSAMLPFIHDFREALATTDTQAVGVGAERLLPYAVVFGVEDRWMEVAAASEVLPTDLEELVNALAGVIAARRLEI
jgi:hypothetical protein